ncbi:MAG: hypothetical protein M1825_005738 [Sarcosagium campestre]|nr:MAG: hypothetical protein M1825_005738 [Sarcosagium campestre]
MNVADPRERQRLQANGPSQPPPRSGQEGRPTAGLNGSHARSSSGTMTRADKFEDEKRRIVASCFSKKDDDGSSLESYLTHVRITEDAAFPSAPPPPDSPANNKKPRIIILALRKSGRIRMHKARENGDGSFSIGKTWLLEDLTGIQSFTGASPRTPEEEQRKQWAGNAGFVVAIGKPYFWLTGTSKEKDFFIASLLKIYRKYTGGKIPELAGFSSKEMDTLLGAQAQQSRPPAIPTPSEQRSSPPVRPPSSGITAASASASTSSADKWSQGSDPRRRPSPDFQRHQREAMERLQGTPPSVEKSPNRRRLASNEPGSSDAQSRPDLKSPPQSSQSIGSNRFESTADRASPSLNALKSPDLTSDYSGSRPVTASPPMNGAASRTSVPRKVLSPDLGRPSAEFDNARPGFRTPSPSHDVDRRGHMRVPSRGSSRGAQAELPSRPSAEISGSPRRARDPLGGSRTATPDSLPAKPGSAGHSTRQTPPLAASTSTLPSSSSTPPPLPDAPVMTTKDAEDHRPGLGPMIKKKSSKDVAGAFRKAATAYNAFRPRAGGAGDAQKEQKETAKAEPDGITGVVPAPSLLRGESHDKSGINSNRVGTPKQGSRDMTASARQTDAVPEVKVTRTATFNDVVETVTTPAALASTTGTAQDVTAPLKAAAMPQTAVEPKRKKRRSDQALRYLSALDVDVGLLNDRALDFEAVLSEFGWEGKAIRTKGVDALDAEIRREIGRVEAGSWLGHLEQKDDRVELVEKMLDKAMAECDELDGLLTLYSVELSTLDDDVAFIEAQSQGLQVQTANQKILQSELQTLLKTISIPAKQLQSLRQASASLDTPSGLEAVEMTLTMLYKAMVTIDPSLGQAPVPSTKQGASGDDGGSSINSANIGGFGNGGFGNSEVGNMKALQEKKEGYRNETVLFLQQLKHFMRQRFGDAATDIAKANEQDRDGALARRTGRPKLEPKKHDNARRELWRYSLLMLFARQVDVLEWEAMIHSYEAPMKGLYQEEFRSNVFAWKRITRKSFGDEQEMLFTHQEKEAEGIATTARKLTVKRSQTLAKSLRSEKAEAASHSHGGAGSLHQQQNQQQQQQQQPQDGKLQPSAAFGGALDVMVPIMFMEQNFVVDFFHASSLEGIDFADAATSALPAESRGGTNLRSRKLFDPDRIMARRVLDLMEEIFSFWPGDVQALVEWAIKDDPLQGVGVLFALERQMAELYESNQEFLMKTLQKVHDRLTALFSRFLDEQVRAIEDTKVKIKRRKGVIGFMKTFPHFASSLEAMLPDPHADLEVRGMVNDAYARINKAMFESLQAIAKETPAVTAQAAASAAGSGAAGAAGGVGMVAVGDPEDKEALNYHILLIENMNHYVEEVSSTSSVTTTAVHSDSGSGMGLTTTNAVLDEWRAQAETEMAEHLGLYLGAVMRRPLGKLLDFVESTETLLQNTTTPSSLAQRPSHSRSTFKKLLSAHDAKEVRRGIEALKKRVEKHFGDADDDPSLSRALVAKVLRECEARYLELGDRVLRIVADVYEGALEWEWRPDEVRACLRR